MSALLDPLPPLPTPTSALHSILCPGQATAIDGTSAANVGGELLIHEPLPLAGLPLAPLCDDRTLAAAPLADDDAAAPLVRVASPDEADDPMLQGWRLRIPDGELASPLRADGWQKVADAPLHAFRGRSGGKIHLQIGIDRP